MRMGPVAGAFLLGTGRGRGIQRFSDTVQGFLASLAPLVAFPLVGAAIMLFSGGGTRALRIFLVTVLAQLVPPVVSHLLAVRWGKAAEWLRFATAFNWCQWMIPLAGFVFLLVLQAGAGDDVSEEAAAELLVSVLALYGLWLHWMVARHGLQLGRLRAAWLVFLVNAATMGVILLPRVLAQLVR